MKFDETVSKEKTIQTAHLAAGVREGQVSDGQLGSLLVPLLADDDALQLGILPLCEPRRFLFFRGSLFVLQPPSHTPHC